METQQQITGARRTIVGFYEDEFEPVGPAWVTEADWNGWAVPHMERADLIAALPDLASADTAVAMDGDVLVVWNGNQCVCGADGGPADGPASCGSGATGCEAFMRIEANPVYGTYDLDALGYTFEEEHDGLRLYDWSTVKDAEPTACPHCDSDDLDRVMVAPLGAEPMGTVWCTACDCTVWSMVAPKLTEGDVR